MKTLRVILFGVVAIVGLIGCGQEAPKTEAPKGSTPASPAASVMEPAGQAVVDSIKAPLDKAKQVENKLEKADEKTTDQVKDTAP